MLSVDILPVPTGKAVKDIQSRIMGAENCSRFGHWEGDTVQGARGKGAASPFADRFSEVKTAGFGKADAISIESNQTDPIQLNPSIHSPPLQKQDG